MDAYRYVVFPRTKQPTVDEVRQLQQHASAYAIRIAYGTTRRDGSFAIAFEAAGFEAALKADRSFAALLRHWETHGCELLSHLPFVKDAAALRPQRPAARRGDGDRLAEPGQPVDRLQAAKELAAKEAVARSRLDVQQSLQRYAALQRFAATFPYALMGLAAIGLIATGFYAVNRLGNSDRERRQQTIERVLDAPLDESLAGQKGTSVVPTDESVVVAVESELQTDVRATSP